MKRIKWKNKRAQFKVLALIILTSFFTSYFSPSFFIFIQNDLDITNFVIVSDNFLLIIDINCLIDICFCSIFVWLPFMCSSGRNLIYGFSFGSWQWWLYFLRRIITSHYGIFQNSPEVIISKIWGYNIKSRKVWGYNFKSRKAWG